MKKILSLIFAFVLVVGLVACSNHTNNSEVNQEPSESSSVENSISQEETVRYAVDDAKVQTDDPSMPTRVIENGTRINMHFGDTVIPGILNDSETAQALIEKLPMTISMNRYATDYCAVLDEELPYSEEAVHNGWLNGDINYEITAPYFAILFDGEAESNTHDNQVNIGVMDCELSRISNLEGSFDVLIELAEESANQGSEIVSTNAPETQESNILVTYFSRSGNTEQVADSIVELTGGTLFEIVPEEPYPDDYDETVERFRRERDEDARPAVAGMVENIESYDVIFVGYPIWGGDIPYVVRTFLEQYDLSGKTIVPFCTHGGSRFGSSLSTLAELCPDSTISEGYEVSGSSAGSHLDEVSEWLDGLNLGN